MSKEPYIKQPTLYILLFLLLLVAYIQSFNGEWHYDDFPNILENTPLHLTELTLTTLKGTFFAYPGKEGTLLRPVSNLTFALNWFFHQDSVVGYHLVNFFIHFLTAVFLYKSCLLILFSPKIQLKAHKNASLIALLATLFWALNPIQVQAVSYIVQRMACLATFFTILGIWSYLQARMTRPAQRRKQVIYYCSTLISFLLALGSKENAVLFPGSIVLIEFFILREDVRLTKQSLLILSAGFLFILGCTLALAGPKIFLSIFDSYTGRSFTPFQRLLTQSRIVTFYLSQIFFPAPSRLSLTHDVHLSTSLFFPFTTLSSIVFLTLLVIFSFRYHKKQPLLSFAILFFLFNHTVESSFLNLEIIFEHRNYLPSLFLFLPLAALLGRSIHHYQQSNRLIFLFLSAGASLLVLLFLVGTFERNKAWLTERSLWEDSLKKAPGHSRSYVNLAHGYYQRDNNDNNKKAFELYWQSLDKYAPNPWKARLAAYGSLGYIMFRYGKYEKALKFYDQALSVAKDKPYGNLTAGILSDKANTLWIAGKKQEALNLISGLAQARPKKGVYLQQYGEMLIGMNRLAEGMIILRHVISEFPMTSTEYRKALLDFALIYARLDSMKKSSFYMRLADRLGVPVVPSSLCFIEASLLAGKKEKTGQAMQHILYKITWAELIAILEERSPNTPILPLNYPYLLQYAEEWLTEQKTP